MEGEECAREAREARKRRDSVNMLIRVLFA